MTHDEPTEAAGAAPAGDGGRPATGTAEGRGDDVELKAIMSDFLREKYGADHPAIRS
jgi:hypothetical protein